MTSPSVVPLRARIRGERVSRFGVAVATWCPFLPESARRSLAARAVAHTRVEVLSGHTVLSTHRMRLDPESLEIIDPDWSDG